MMRPARKFRFSQRMAKRSSIVCMDISAPIPVFGWQSSASRSMRHVKPQASGVGGPACRERARLADPHDPAVLGAVAHFIRRLEEAFRRFERRLNGEKHCAPMHAD